MKKIIAISLAVVLIAGGIVSSAYVQAGSNNEVSTSFVTTWEYIHLEDEFTDSEIVGRINWNIDLYNEPDGTGANITDLSLNLISDMDFDYLETEAETRRPPIYRWLYGDIPEEDEVDLEVGFENPEPVPVTWIPGYDISREVDILVFTETANQTLSINITPRDQDVIDAGIWVEVESEENKHVNPVIIDWDTDPVHDIELEDDGHDLMIEPQLVIDTTWTCTVLIEVMPKVGHMEFMPTVIVGSGEEANSGVEIGICMAYPAFIDPLDDPVNNVGIWLWNAGGSCEWHWEEELNKSVILLGISTDLKEKKDKDENGD